MTFLTSLDGRIALTAAALLTGSALLISCAGTLDEDEFPPGGQQGAGGDTQGSGTTSPAVTTGADAATTAATGGDPAATTAATGGDPAATTAATGGDPGATTSTATGPAPTGCAEAPAMITAKCANAGCHDANSKQAGLSLASGWETSIRGQTSACGGMVLVPGDPDASSVYTKVTPDPPCNNRMPLGAAPLSDAEITCLHDFIAALTP
ncbi:c-type cytochrome domain-containing protein [Sorangium cellulosum]|uniref:c-type cytochrome domain-containing protein n=1 Tax=Sorangium cellulosum TaxID=56 RepID=UPI003D9A2228